MTETSTVATSTVARDSVRRGVRIGVLSNIEPREIDGMEIMVGTLTRTYKGQTIAETFSVSGDALIAVKDLIVEGASVRLWGEFQPDYFKVRGPDLTRRTLVRELNKIISDAKPVVAVESDLEAARKAARRRSFFIARQRRLKAAA